MRQYIFPFFLLHLHLKFRASVSLNIDDGEAFLPNRRTRVYFNQFCTRSTLQKAQLVQWCQSDEERHILLTTSRYYHCKFKIYVRIECVLERAKHGLFALPDRFCVPSHIRYYVKTNSADHQIRHTRAINLMICRWPF